MKRQIKFMALVVALSGVAALNVKVALASKKSYDLTMNRISTLDGDPEGGINKDKIPSGGGITTQNDCAKIGGYWNMALVCADGGTTIVQCEFSGKIVVFGMTFEGAYKKGSKYAVAWERWSCANVGGNCCNPSGQGIKVSKVSLN